MIDEINLNRYPVRENSLLEYLSPFGVISTKEFIYRLLAFIGLLLVVVLAFSLLIKAVPQYLERSENQDKVASLFFLALLIVLLLFWFLFATVTKEYRTYGMPLPFIFALATPVIPLLFIVKYILSSKLERQINQRIASEQLAYRQAQKALARQRRQPQRD